jgi:putative hydrolase of the HAD superfamily
MAFRSDRRGTSCEWRVTRVKATEEAILSMPADDGVRGVRALLIDLDGVVRLWDPAHFPAAEAGAGLPPGALRRAAFAPDLLHPAITGRVTDEAWRRQIVARLRAEHPAADAERAVAAWSAPAGAVDAAVLALVRACRARAPVVLLTNATSRLGADLARLGLGDAFDHVINSSAVGWIKPQPEVFAVALHAAGVPAAQALFVDDTAANVAAAAQLGLVAHHYRGAASLRQALALHGLADESNEQRATSPKQ